MAIKIKVGGGDSKKKATKVKVTTKASSADVESANKFAKEFALRKGLISGENTHTGGIVPQFVNPSGLPAQTVAPVGMLSNKVPAEITSLEWDAKANLPYYIDPVTPKANFTIPIFIYFLAHNKRTTLFFQRRHPTVITDFIDTAIIWYI